MSAVNGAVRALPAGESFANAQPISAIDAQPARASPWLREGLEHIAEATERDGAQVAAHDEALGAGYEGLPSDELVARHDELRSEAGAEAQNQRSHRDLEHARAFCRQFFRWYNHDHRHSGIGLMAPATVHHGKAKEAHAARRVVLAAAYAANPERFVRGAPQPPTLPTAAWINKPDTEEVAH